MVLRLLSLMLSPDNECYLSCMTGVVSEDYQSTAKKTKIHIFDLYIYLQQEVNDNFSCGNVHIKSADKYKYLGL